MNDPKPMGKPYLATEMDYLKLYRNKTWEDGDPTGRDGSEYSEFQKPYKYDEDEPEDHPWWEWTWPDLDWPDLSLPDVEPHPCSVDENCEWAKIFGPDSVDCGGAYTYTQMHVWLGCSVAPWWAAFGSWELDTADPDNVRLLFEGPVMATVQVDSTAASGTYTIKYNGPLECVDSMEVVVKCDECCLDFTLTGSATVNPGATWTGTISPACPTAECEVSSGSGCVLSCEVNDLGSEVTVNVGAADCGSFTVTVSDTVEGCDPLSATATVRINNTGQGGAWVRKEANYCGSGGCGCAGSYSFSPCIDEDNIYKYGTGAGADCASNYTYSCSQISYCAPSTQCACDPVPCCTDTDNCEGRTCISGPYCPALIWDWDKCEWECSC